MHVTWPTWLSHIPLRQLQLPSQCLICRTWPCRDILCNDCWRRFTASPIRCQSCAAAIPGLSATQPHCGTCLRRSPPWTRAHVWIDYSYPWSQLIIRWKFSQQAALATHFARWMREDALVQAMLTQADILIPIPLSSARMRERGYNPAAQLAHNLQPLKNRPNYLERVHHTAAQSGLTRAHRLRNLRNAFAVPTQHKEQISGQSILLIDDVITTGSTLATASQCLLSAGAAQIHVLCMARTP